MLKALSARAFTRIGITFSIKQL